MPKRLLYSTDVPQPKKALQMSTYKGPPGSERFKKGAKPGKPMDIRAMVEKAITLTPAEEKAMERGVEKMVAVRARATGRVMEVTRAGLIAAKGPLGALATVGACTSEEAMANWERWTTTKAGKDFVAACNQWMVDPCPF